MYFKKQMFEKVKEAGVSISYQTLLKYEKNGVIPPPQRVGSWRMYSDEDIALIIEKVKTHRTMPRQAPVMPVEVPAIPTPDIPTATEVPTNTGTTQPASNGEVQQ